MFGHEQSEELLGHPRPVCLGGTLCCTPCLCWVWSLLWLWWCSTECWLRSLNLDTNTPTPTSSDPQFAVHISSVSLSHMQQGRRRGPYTTGESITAALSKLNPRSFDDLSLVEGPQSAQSRSFPLDCISNQHPPPVQAGEWAGPRTWSLHHNTPSCPHPWQVIPVNILICDTGDTCKSPGTTHIMRGLWCSVPWPHPHTSTAGIGHVQWNLKYMSQISFVIYILYRVKWIKSRNTILNYATLSRKKLKRKERESG